MSPYADSRRSSASDLFFTEIDPKVLFFIKTKQMRWVDAQASRKKTIHSACHPIRSHVHLNGLLSFVQNNLVCTAVTQQKQKIAYTLASLEASVLPRQASAVITGLKWGYRVCFCSLHLLSFNFRSVSRSQLRAGLLTVSLTHFLETSSLTEMHKRPIDAVGVAATGTYTA